MIDQADSDMPWPTVLEEAPTLNKARDLPNIFARFSLDFHKIIRMDCRSVDDILPTVCGLQPDARGVIHTARARKCAHRGFVATTGDIVATSDTPAPVDPDEKPRFVKALLVGANLTISKPKSRACIGGPMRWAAYTR